MSTTPDSPSPTPEPPENPHGVDHARERRLVIMFIAIIGVCFIIAGILLAAAILFDITRPRETVEPPVFTTQPAPEDQPPAPTTHP